MASTASAGWCADSVQVKILHKHFGTEVRVSAVSFDTRTNDAQVLCEVIKAQNRTRNNYKNRGWAITSLFLENLNKH